MLEHWERLAEAQRIRQEIETEFQEALSQLGREAAERLRGEVYPALRPERFEAKEHRLFLDRCRRGPVP